MAKITIALALILTLLGVGTYLGSPDANPSKTALIPSVFGVLLLGCGLAALQPSRRKHAMHAAASIGLLGALAASGRGVMAVSKLVGGEPDRPCFRAADGGPLLVAGRAVRQQLHRRSPPSGGRRGGIQRRRAMSQAHA